MLINILRGVIIGMISANNAAHRFRQRGPVSYTHLDVYKRQVLSQLRAFAQQQQLHAAWIAGCTGSLTDVALRYAGQENTALLSGKFEVIALNGTLEQSGEHLHLLSLIHI